MDERDSNSEVLRRLNIAFKNERRDRIEDDVDEVIKMYLSAETRRGDEPLTNTFSVFSNYLKMMIRRKVVNPNFILSSVIKWTKSYIGLFIIGMCIREGANPNIYLTAQEYGNLHILAWTSIVRGTGDFLYNYIATVLRLLGSDIYRPAIRFEGDSTDVDVRLIEQSFDDYRQTLMEQSGIRREEVYAEGDYYRAGMNVKEFVNQSGYNLEDTVTAFLNSIDDNWLLDIMIAADDIEKYKILSGLERGSAEPTWGFLLDIVNNNVTLTRFIIDLSIAGAKKIAASMDDKKYPIITETINGQSVPLFAASVSNDLDMFDLFIRKGSSVKYITINTLLTFYKIFKNNDIKLYEWAFQMVRNAVRIGADIDLYQFNFLVSMADFDEIEEIRKAYEIPKWKKLCSIKRDKGVDFSPARDEFRQIAFKLNLDYHLSEEKLCDKFREIELIGQEQYLDSAIKRQKERVAIDVEGPGTSAQPRCDPKSMVVKNPYAYNDAQMAFYKSPKDGKVWCFTSDLFASLISSKKNEYNGEDLPQKFIQTLKAQLNTLREIGVYETNESIKDALDQFYSRSDINNKKTDRQYNTVMTVLSMYGVSQERFESLRTEVLNDTILQSIANVNLINFNTLPMILKQRTTARIIYSLAKRDTPMAREGGEITDELSKELFSRISVAISGDTRDLEEYDEYGMPIYDEEGNPSDVMGYNEIVGRNY